LFKKSNNKNKQEVKQQRPLPVTSIFLHGNVNIRAFGAMDPDLCKSVYTRELWRTSCIEGADLYSSSIQFIRPCSKCIFLCQRKKFVSLKLKMLQHRRLFTAIGYFKSVVVVLKLETHLKLFTHKHIVVYFNP